MNNQKQNLGQFNTKNGVWLRPHIAQYIRDVGAKTVVDPFVGAGDLLHAVNDMPWRGVIGYDIDPSLGWPLNDGLLDIPYHKDAIVITNPPYLAKNSANRNDFESYKYFEDNVYEDLYQIAIYRVLAKYEHAVFIIPETFFQCDFFHEFIDLYTVIEENPFTDTDCPVCVVCFHKDNNDFMRFSANNYRVYKNDDYVVDRYGLEDIVSEFSSPNHAHLVFNDPNGVLGLRGVDGVAPRDRIRFTWPEQLNYDPNNIKESSRAITIIDIDGVQITDGFIEQANYFLELLRHKTQDVVLSPFKNNNKLGQRRRRLDYYWARKIIEKTMEALDK
jgi:hypothetical protein